MRPASLCWVLLAAASACAGQTRLDPATGEIATIDPTRPPTGIEIVQLLLENQNVPMSDAPLCAAGAGVFSDPRWLQHELAVLLGSALDDPQNEAVLSGSCEASELDQEGGEPVPVWDCGLTVVQRNARDEVVSSGTILFALRKTDWHFYPASLRCF